MKLIQDIIGIMRDTSFVTFMLASDQLRHSGRVARCSMTIGPSGGSTALAWLEKTVEELPWPAWMP